MTNNDEWFFTKSVYKKSMGLNIPLKKGYFQRNIISASFKAPEVVIKIPRRTGNSKGLTGIKNHLNYITRNGKLELETSTGEIINSKEQITKLVDDLKNFGIAKESKKREVLNIVLSMPPGTDKQSLLNGVREFAKERFGNHIYVFALHDDTSHPHVHLTVVMKDCFGKRLNPRKADIQEWRIRFADKLRDNGIACSATYRQHRGIYQKKENGIVKNIKKRGGYSRVIEARKRNLEEYVKNNTTPPTPYLDRVKKSRVKILTDYVKFAEMLYQTGDLKSYNAVKSFINEVANKPIISKTKEEYLAYKNRGLNSDKEIDM